MLLAIQIVLGVLVTASIGHYALSALWAWQFFRSDPTRPGPEGPGVSVLIPVCGLEPGAEANWRSFLAQEYREYEVLFGVMDLDDPAVPLLREIAAAHPERARFVHCARPLGINHQVS